MEMSKGDFARQMNLSPGRISQMIKAKIIGEDAITPEGRVKFEIASAQIASRRHVGQSLGNGLMTRLEGAPKPDLSQPAKSDESEEGDVAKQIQLERLEQERRKNRQQ